MTIEPIRVVAEEYFIEIIINNGGIQKEKDLNSFIYTPEFEKVVGTDLRFVLQVLLTDKTGYNLRNNIAHGLCTDAHLLNEPAIITWVLSLFLCQIFYNQYSRAANNQEKNNLTDKEVTHEEG